MGYSDHEGRKGSKVIRLSDGKLIDVAYEQVFRFYESVPAFPRGEQYDAWLRKEVGSDLNASASDKGCNAESAGEGVIHPSQVVEASEQEVTERLENCMPILHAPSPSRFRRDAIAPAQQNFPNQSSPGNPFDQEISDSYLSHDLIDSMPALEDESDGSGDSDEYKKDSGDDIAECDADEKYDNENGDVAVDYDGGDSHDETAQLDQNEDAHEVDEIIAFRRV